MEDMGYIQGIKSWSGAEGIHNQVALGSNYPLYKSTILELLYVINQYQNLTVHSNPIYLQWAQLCQLDKRNWDTKSGLSYKQRGHITITKLWGV